MKVLLVAIVLLLAPSAEARPVPPTIQTSVYNTATRVASRVLALYDVNSMDVVVTISHCPRPAMAYRCHVRYYFKGGQNGTCLTRILSTRKRWWFGHSTCPPEWLGISRAN